tara:strand:- start:168 stop:644 length:477 start_codon:yes stop_codon:yes gene_type:complete
MNIFSNKKKFYIFILIYSLFGIFFALYVEYILNYPPCVLCIYQRIPYVVAIFVSFAGYNYFKNNKILILIFMIFLISALISGYHYGIEKDIFEEFSGCSASTVDIINKEELLKSLKNNTISCKDVNFKLLGFSLAGINFIFSILIAIYSLRTLFYAKN